MRIDKNFTTLPLFFGLIIVLTIDNLLKKYNNAFLIFCIFIFEVSILISGSRRGLILFGLILLVLLTKLCVSFINKKHYIKRLRLKLLSLIIPITFFISIIYVFLFHTSPELKNNLFKTVYQNNLQYSKKKLLLKVYNFYSIFDNSLKYSEFSNFVWPSIFDPKNPDSKWGTRIHKTVFPLYGENVKIVPEGTKGYLMDKSCNATFYKNNSFSHTVIGCDSVSKGDSVEASVYCYVSKDFNGKWARITSEGASSSYIYKYYNLNKKATWQKLKLKSLCNQGKASVYMSFAQYGVPDFSKLNGYVIFAHPEYKIIKKSNDSISRLKKRTIKNEKVKENVNLSNQITGTTLLTSKKTDYIKTSSKTLFNQNKLLKDTIKIDSDPIRNCISNFVSEDTTYHPYKTKLQVDTISNNLISPRTVRWQFAWQIFTKEYNWIEKILGNGFNFFNWYGYYFLKDRTKSDWPHNPFLTVLLYSGIIGLILYLILLYKVFKLYIKYIKEYYLFFIFFLITFYFSFFSAGHPFDPPVMGFLVMLPFLIHTGHKKDKISETIKKYENN